MNNSTNFARLSRGAENNTRELAPVHLQDWLCSGVSQEITNFNVVSLSNSRPYEYLCYSKNLKRTNSGRLAASVMRRYRHTELGGWWCDGLDPLNNWEPMPWGCFKPDRPRKDPETGKVVKYEHPPKEATRIFCLRVTEEVWQRVAARYEVEMPDEEGHGGAFWRWVVEHPEIPVVVVEGAKKAGCLLSNGYVAIALPGVSSGFRRELASASPVRHLIPELEVFAAGEREILICFDRDRKRNTRKTVATMLAITGRLFAEKGCPVRVVQLPGANQKLGVDDFIVANGAGAFEALYAIAPSLEHWNALQHYELTYAPSLVVKEQYLSNIPYPRSGLACIKSPKNSNKTGALEPFIQEQTGMGRRTLILTHRIQLGRAIASRLGLDWIEDKAGGEWGILGYGLCVDSLHPNSMAYFDPEIWAGRILILDEAEQVVWHLLNSQTCYDKRVAIIETLRRLLNVIASTGGLIVAQDADLSDVAIEFLKGMLQQSLEPWILTNEWRPQKGWDVQYYCTPNPAMLFNKAMELLERGEKIWIQTDTQKAKNPWSSQNLELRLEKLFPDLRILRIDSDTVRDPSHGACGIVDNINNIIANYDVVIASPSISTGVDISVRGHFSAVFGIFQGSCSEPETRQALARVRDERAVRYVWARKVGVGRIGSGSSNYREMIKSQHKVVKTNIQLLQNVDFDLDEARDANCLRTWAKMAARVNAGMRRYRAELAEGLRDEGHRVRNVYPPDSNLKDLENQLQIATEAGDFETFAALQKAIDNTEPEINAGEKAIAAANSAQKQVRDEAKQEEADAVELAPMPSEEEAAYLQNKRSLVRSERNQLRKYQLSQRYGVPVTAELKMRDDNGWHGRLRLHYYLDNPEELVRARDRRHLNRHLERGGSACLWDIRLLGAKVKALQLLGVEKLLDEEATFTQDSETIRELVDRVWQYRQDVKDFVGVGISEAMMQKPMQVVQALLATMDLKLTGSQRRREDGSRERVYRYVPPQDCRWDVFAAWRKRDEVLNTANQQVGVTTPFLYVNNNRGCDKESVMIPPLEDGAGLENEPLGEPGGRFYAEPGAAVRNTTSRTSELEKLAASWRYQLLHILHVLETAAATLVPDRVMELFAEAQELELKGADVPFSGFWERLVASVGVAMGCG